MKTKKYKQISLTIALFLIIIGLSACSNQNVSSQTSDIPTKLVNYNQNTTASTNNVQNYNVPSPRTGQS